MSKPREDRAGVMPQGVAGNHGRTARKILIVVAHRMRDFEGSALLAFHLERRHGHRVNCVLPTT